MSRRLILIAVTLAVLVACKSEPPVPAGPYGKEVAAAIPLVEKATGLTFKAPPKLEVRTRAELKAFLEAKFDEDQPALEMAGQEQAYRLFGLLPDTLDLRSFLLKLLAEQVIGYYDPATKVLYVVQDGAGSSAPSPDVLNITITHELVHALQDQYLPLDPQGRDGEQHTLAHWAAYKGTVTVLEYLAAQQVPLDVPDMHKRTPLHWAAREGREMVIQFLLQHGARVDVQDNDGKRPLDYATQRRHREAARLLAGPQPASVNRLVGTMQLVVRNKFALLSASVGVVYTLLVFASTHFIPGFLCHLPVMLYFAKNFAWCVLFKRPEWSSVSALDRRLAEGDITPRTVDESVEGMWLSAHREPSSVFVVFGFITLQIAAFNEVGTAPPLPFWLFATVFTLSVMAMKWTAFDAVIPRGSLVDSPVMAAVKERKLSALNGRIIDQDLHARVPLRAFYCKQLDAVVRFYDSWSNTFDCPIGRFNHRWFIYALLSFFALELSVVTVSWSHLSQLVCSGTEAPTWTRAAYYLAVHNLPCRHVPVDDSWYHFVVPSAANHAGVWLIVYAIFAIIGVLFVLSRQLQRIAKGITKSEEAMPFAPNVQGELVSIITRTGRCIYSEGNAAGNILLMLLGQWGARWDGVYTVPHA